MQAKDISWKEFLEAVNGNDGLSAYTLLCSKYPTKVVMAKYDMANRKGYLDYGVSLRTAWLTSKGEQALCVLQ
jgi:hypothetical protein